MYHLQQKLFNGFLTKTANERRYLLATPEKALLDVLYFRYRLRGKPNWKEWELNKLDWKKLRVLSRDYPPTIQKMLHSMGAHVT